MGQGPKAGSCEHDDEGELMELIDNQLPRWFLQSVHVTGLKLASALATLDYHPIWEINIEIKDIHNHQVVQFCIPRALDKASVNWPLLTS